MTYEFVLRGEIGDRFGLLFEGMRLERDAGRTVLTGPVRRPGAAARGHRADPGARPRARVRQPPPGRRVMTAPDTIVLIHGFWVTPRSWEHWIAHYEARGLHGARAGLPGLRGGGRGAQRRPDADRGGDRAGRSSSTSSRSSARSTRRRSSSATRPAACSRRSCSTTASAPPAWRSTRRRPRASARAAVAGQGDVPGAQEPGQPPPRGRLHARAVALRVHQHASPRRSRARCTSATTSPHPATIFWGSALANVHPGTRTTLGELPQRRPRAAAVHLRHRGPSDAAEHPAVERQALQVEHRSPRSRSSRARTCCPRRTAGSRSPTTRSTGPSQPRPAAGSTRAWRHRTGSA